MIIYIVGFVALCGMALVSFWAIARVVNVGIRRVLPLKEKADELVAKS